MQTHTSRGEAEVVEEHDNVGVGMGWDAGVAEATEVGDEGAASAAIWWHHYGQGPGKLWRSTARMGAELCFAT